MVACISFYSKETMHKLAVRVRKELCKGVFKKFRWNKDTIKSTGLGGLVAKPGEMFRSGVQISKRIN